MSASREKDRRKEARSEGMDKREIKKQEYAKKKKHNKTIGTVVGVAVALLLCVLIFFNSNLMFTAFAAVKAGDWKFSNAQFNYEFYTNYYTTYENIRQTYGDYASYLLDTSKPLSEQQYNDEQTWQEFFEQGSIERLTQLAMFWDEGHAAGFAESAQINADVDALIDTIKATAKSAGYPNVNAYLRSLYGKGCSEKLVRDILYKTSYAAEYSQKLLDDWKAGFTEQELDEHYQTISNTYNRINYARYYADGSVPEPVADENTPAETAPEVDPAAVEAAMADAKALAELVASADSEDLFYVNVVSNCPEEERLNYASPDSLVFSTSPNNLGNEEWLAWFTDPARQQGDTTVFASETGYYAMMFISIDENQYNMENYHMIKLNIAAAEDGTIGADQIKERQTVMDEIVAKYEANPTVEQFEALAQEYSQDVNSTSVGGRYANVSKTGISDVDIRSYVFADERVEGDYTTMLLGNALYFILIDAEGGNYSRYIATETKANDNYTNYVEEKTELYPVSTTMFFKPAR